MHGSVPSSVSAFFPLLRSVIQTLVVVALLFGGSRARAATYYVHPVVGDDARAGTSAEAPWKTLEKAKAVRLQPGDRVLLAAGQTFQGQLAFAGLAGTAEQPIEFSSYPATAAAGMGATTTARASRSGRSSASSRSSWPFDLAPETSSLRPMIGNFPARPAVRRSKPSGRLRPNRFSRHRFTL